MLLSKLVSELKITVSDQRVCTTLVIRNSKLFVYNQLMFRWEERWEHLQLILEVYQFARDAAVAEAWLLAQDPYLKSEEYGHTIDEVENLIKKHEAFEKAAAAQEDRFSALERLTTVSIKTFLPLIVVTNRPILITNLFSLS